MRILIVGTFVMSAALAFAVAVATFGTGVAAPRANGFITHWANVPSTIDELYTRADAIARVRIIAVEETREVGPRTLIGGTVFTDYRAEVVKVYKGTLDKFVTLVQFGGVNSHGVFQADEDPLYEPGMVTLLFLQNLTNDPIHSPGLVKYAVLAPSGRFDIVNGKLSTHYKEAQVSNQYRGRDPAELDRELDRRRR